jgi:hypothetical protein
MLRARSRLVRDADGRFTMSGVRSPGRHLVISVSVETTDGKIGGFAELKLEPGETKEVTITVRRHVVVIGRIVSWGDNTPAARIHLVAEGGGIRRRESTAGDGTFRVASALTGPIRIRTYDDLVDDQWRREVPEGKAVVDLGTLEVSPALPRALGMLGCPRCHTDDADFIQTVADRTPSPFYDKELNARAARLDALNGGFDAPPVPFGPLQSIA